MPRYALMLNEGKGVYRAMVDAETPMAAWEAIHPIRFPLGRRDYLPVATEHGPTAVLLRSFETREVIGEVREWTDLAPYLPKDTRPQVPGGWCDE